MVINNIDQHTSIAHNAHQIFQQLPKMLTHQFETFLPRLCSNASAEFPAPITDDAQVNSEYHFEDKIVSGDPEALEINFYSYSTPEYIPDQLVF